MTADQRFLKAAHIRPDDPARENWITWREEDIAGPRLQLAEAEQLEYRAIETAIKREERMNMWKLATFAGWCGLILFATARYWA